MIKEKFISKILIWVILLLFNNMAIADQAKTKIKIFINKTVDHPALLSTTQGIIESLIDGGYNPKQNLDLRIESAQGNASLSQQIANKFIGQNPDMVIGVGTMATQSFIKYAKTGQTKLVFSSVTDPVGAGLVGKNNNIYGVSNFIQLEPQLELFVKILPSLKKLGILYNSGEANSIAIVKKLEEICPKFGLILIKQTATKTSEIVQGAINLARNSDAIFISNDNTALSALKTIIKAANNAKIPVFVSDTDAIGSGSLAAFGANQYNIGWQTGKMVINILKGQQKIEEAVIFPDNAELYLDLKVARELGITISDNVISQTTKIVNE